MFGNVMFLEVFTIGMFADGGRSSPQVFFLPFIKIYILHMGNAPVIIIFFFMAVFIFWQKKAKKQLEKVFSF